LFAQLLVFIMTLTAAAVSPAFGQAFYGFIFGTVTDASGAVANAIVNERRNL
jgi:hypothetical protein